MSPLIELECGDYAIDRIPDGAILTAYAPDVVRGSLIKIGDEVFRVVLIDNYLEPAEMFIAKVEAIAR